MFAALLAVPGFATACGGGDDDDATDGTADGDAGIGCREDPRAETFVANMEHAGTGGLLTFVLEDGAPAPPIKGTNTWNVQILDAAQEPVSGATVTVRPFMPDHGHGTSVVPQVTAGQAGEYTIASLYFFMPGLWEVTINAEAGDTADTVKFSFCIQG